MSERSKVKTIDVDGEQVDVFVDGDDGRFYARLDGIDVYNVNMKALETKLREQSRQKRRLNIEGTTIGSRWSSEKATFEDITIIGKHGGNGNLLYRGTNDKHTQQMRSSDDDHLMHRLSKAERAEYTALVNAAAAAEKATVQWRKGHQLNVAKAIKQQLGEEPTT